MPVGAISLYRQVAFGDRNLLYTCITGLFAAQQQHVRDYCPFCLCRLAGLMHILVKEDICLPEQRLFKRSEKVEDGEGILSVEEIAHIGIVDHDASNPVLLRLRFCLSYPVVACAQRKLRSDGNDTGR